MSIADRLESLTPEQRSLFELLRKKRETLRPPQAPPVARVSGPDGAGDWPLTFDQERLWFLHQLDPAGSAYNMPTATRLRGPLDVATLAESICRVVRRHGSWRTSFPGVDGRPVQRVAPEPAFELPVVDLGALPAELRDATLQSLLLDDARRPFVLATGPLVRAALVRLGRDEHVCILTVHHIVSDLVSFQIFWREVAAAYVACRASRPATFSELPVQFADFAVWQRSWLQGEVLEAQIRWWAEQLAGFPRVLDLPTDRPWPPRPQGRGGRLPLRLAECTAGVRELSRREGATRFMTLMAVCAALLGRLCGQDRLILGTLNANRNRPETAPLLGFFLTQLPFGIDLTGDPPFRELLARVRQVAVGAFAHQDLPFGKLVEGLQPERDLARLPLVQALFQLIDVQQQGGGHGLGDLEIEALDAFDGSSRYDLMLTLFEQPDDIRGFLEHNADVLEAPTAHRLAGLFLEMVRAALADPGTRLSALPAFSEAARHQVLIEWNDTALERREGEPATVVEAFAAQAARTPGSPACSGEGWSLDYAGLEERTNRLARFLHRLGVGPGAVVGICLERTIEVPVALLGVIKSGAAYLPLDLAHPAERRAFMVADAGAPLLLTQARLLSELSGIPDTVRRVCLDTGWEEIARESGATLPPVAGPGDLAYVIYTSGSTGRPKGVEIPHGALEQFLRAMRRLYTVGPGDVMPAITTIAFDLSVPEVYLPLTGGGTVPFVSRETAADGALLARTLAEHGATVLQATPATWRMLVEAGWTGGDLLLLSGAEALGRDLADRLLPLGRGLWNFYGPTETTVWSTAWRAEAGGPISIGRPIANARVHLLDRRLSPVPLGAVGEIFLGGAGVARGYLGRPDLTAERFLPDPFADPTDRSDRSDRLYRTGDLARWLPDGRLEYLGRTDHQVKLRGFRIELGEIEAALERHPAVAEAAVILRQERQGDVRLSAWMAPAADAAAPSPGELRAFLRERLPDYMLPSAFTAVPALPRNANGKVDRRALALLRVETGPARGGRVAPRTPSEELLAAVWEEVLEVETAGVTDDFFELGGHSLLATRLVSRVRDAFGVDLPVRGIFQAPTIAAQAELIATLRMDGAAAESGRIRPLPRSSWPLAAPLSFAQERLWFLDRLMPGSPAYNLPVALRLDGPLDAGALAGAFSRLVERHETLRTTLPERGLPGAEGPGGETLPVQEVAERGTFVLREIDLTESADPDAEARRLAAADPLRPFDLAAGPLLRATLLHLGPERHVLLLAMHHIVSDAWSMGVLVDDLIALHADRPLPGLPVQYADYAVWQRERLSPAEVDRQLAFWRDQLAGAPPTLDLPTDRPRPAVQSPRGGRVPFDLDAGTSAALASLARRLGATLYMILLAGWGSLLGRLASRRDLVVGTAVANRDRPELERLIGFFVNTLAMRIDLTGAPSFEDLLRRVRHRVLDAFAHRDLPFEKLVEELHPARDRSRQPVFQVMLTFQNVPRGQADVPGLTLSALEVEGQTTTFDLTLTLFEEAGRIAGRLEYAGDLFDRSTVERWAGGFGRILAAAAAAPATPAAELPLLSPEELRQVLDAPNQTAAAYPRDASLGDLFAGQAARQPKAVAVAGDTGEVSWEELERRSARVARRLLGLGLDLEERVGLVAERSPDLIAGLVGIVRAGGAYVPLDPAYPPERLAWMLQDSGVRLLLAARRLLDTLPAAALPPELDVLDLDEAVTVEAPEAPLPAVPAEALAYVMYTSGSTGTPKGVAVTHRNVVRLVCSARKGDQPGYADLGPEQVWLQFAPVSFDASTLEIWAPLLNGGRLALMPPGRASLDDLAEAVARFGVTSLWLTAGLFHQMVEHRLDGLRPLRQLLAGGDVVDPEAARRVLESLQGIALIDGYGPTEGTTFTCCHRITGTEPGAAVPIGRPIANARVYLLDEALQPVPPGVAGELWAGGDGLARGYLDRPDLTAERFLPDPFSGLPGERLYRTGDRARFKRDGALEFLGRLDGQVKIRGFRVEPGEVEAALLQHPAVRRAAVLSRKGPQDGREGKVLAAFVALAEPASAAELQRFLSERLPEAMVPSIWAFLEELPLTPNGKVDRRALAALEGEVTRAKDYVPPRIPLEERLVEAVANVLDLDPERVGIYDNFFDLGGHSLLATRLAARLRQQHGIEVPLQLLFDSAHLADLADRITERELAEAGDSLLEEMLAEMESPE